MSCCWEGGWGAQSEDEREQAWKDPADEAADAWKGGERPDQGDEWKRDGWRTGPMTPEEKMYRDLLADDEDDGG